MDCKCWFQEMAATAQKKQYVALSDFQQNGPDAQEMGHPRNFPVRLM